MEIGRLQGVGGNDNLTVRISFSHNLESGRAGPDLNNDLAGLVRFDRGHSYSSTLVIRVSYLDHDAIRYGFSIDDDSF